MSGKKRPKLHNDAAATLWRRRVRILVLLYWAPYRRNKMILCSFAIVDQALASFTYVHPMPIQVLPQALVVLRQPTELELGHGLLLWTGAHDVYGMRVLRVCVIYTDVLGILEAFTRML